MGPEVGRYLRSLLRLQVKGVSDRSPLGSLHAALHKLIVHVLLHVGARASAAALALVEEQGKVGLLHRVLHWEGKSRHWSGSKDSSCLCDARLTTTHTVGVGQDDVGALSSQLQGDLLQVAAAGGLLNEVTHLRDADTEATMLLPLRIHLKTGISSDV